MALGNKFRSTQQALVDQGHVEGSKWERLPSHLGEVVLVPVRFHHAAGGMADNSLKNVPDLVRDHMSCQRRNAPRIDSLLHSIKEDHNAGPLVRHCVG